MSVASSDDADKPMEQPKENLSVTTADSDKTSTPPKNLSDMPVDVVGLIIERSDYRQQLKLRKVSKSLRALVDNRKPECKSIEVQFGDDFVDIVFDDYTFSSDFNDYCLHSVTYSRESMDDEYYDDDDEDDNRTINVIREDFEKVAFDDLASTLKNPKLQLEELSFPAGDIVNNNFSRMKCVLEALDHQVSVKAISFEVSSLSSFLTVLPYFKPGLLEKIILHVNETEVNWSTYSIEMDQVALLDQWKQARELELYNFSEEFPMKHATHFKRFSVHLRSDGEQFARMKEFLFKLDNFEQFTLSFTTYFSPGFIYKLLGAPVSSTATNEIFHHPIPNSDNFFRVYLAKGN